MRATKLTIFLYRVSADATGQQRPPTRIDGTEPPPGRDGQIMTGGGSHPAALGGGITRGGGAKWRRRVPGRIPSRVRRAMKTRCQIRVADEEIISGQMAATSVAVRTALSELLVLGSRLESSLL